MPEEQLLQLVSSSVFQRKIQLHVDNDVFDEVKKHAIEALPAQILPSVTMPDELRKKWKAAILQRLRLNMQNKYIQDHLPITVPYVILKGTAAAQYYPNPDCRTLGDIDIMTRREDFDQALKELTEDGFVVVNTLNREISLRKQGVTVELHRYFASLNEIEYAKYLDDLIIENIQSNHKLPDPVNGLVLLEHISQHLENGLGLRQIIDWMMFVDKCLPDAKWPEFRIMAEKTGLKMLAIVSTRMCELHLGLPKRKWCAKADPALCNQLMEYVLACGNFGMTRLSDNEISENVFAYATKVSTAFKLLQKQGLANWKAARKYSVLRPFAWIYQGLRYAYKGLGRDSALRNLRKEYSTARKRNAMFDALGVKTAAKGIVIYKNGKYVKE